jgi:hypothetical protein
MNRGGLSYMHSAPPKPITSTCSCIVDAVQEGAGGILAGRVTRYEVVHGRCVVHGGVRGRCTFG